MLESKQYCKSCGHSRHIKCYPFVRAGGLLQRSEICRSCERTHKQCSRCDRYLPNAKFTKDLSRPGGLAVYCRDCRKEREQAPAVTRQCEDCGEPLSRKARLSRCVDCRRAGQMTRLDPHGVLFPGLAAMKRPVLEGID